jgi:hypothetical protein
MPKSEYMYKDFGNFGNFEYFNGWKYMVYIMEIHNEFPRFFLSFSWH